MLFDVRLSHHGSCGRSPADSLNQPLRFSVFSPDLDLLRPYFQYQYPTAARIATTNKTIQTIV